MSKSNEYLLNNALTKDFQRMLRPYYLLQRMLFASKYGVKDNFVLPNSKAYCGFSVLVLCVVTYAYVAVSLDTPCTIENECPLMTDVHNLLARFIATACTATQTESSVKLLIQMQTIDRKLKSLGVSNLPYFVTKHWCSVVCVLTFYGVEMSVTALNTDRFSLISYVSMFLMVIFDLDTLCATCVVEFLSSRLECILNLFTGYYRHPQNVSARNDLHETFKNQLNVLNEILKAFNLSHKFLQYSILIDVVTTFIDSLISVQIVIEWAKNTKSPNIYQDISVIYIITVAWNIKKIAFVIMFSLACERFYYRLDSIKSTCAAILELYPEKDEYRKTVKNVLRLCNANCTKMRVCGLFAVDAALPLRLVGLTSTYCIVLLQFAFL